MNEQYISILICGNPSANAGWSDIALFNSASFEVADSIYGGFDHLERFYTVRIEQSALKGLNGQIINSGKVIYTLVRNNVKSSGAVRAGRLKIAFSIPAGYALPQGVDPKQVLDELEAAFFSECMTGPDMSGAYHFKEQIGTPQCVEAIGMKYPLRQVEAPFRAMNPTGETAFFEAGVTANVGRILANVQYPEFRPYREIVVAESAQGCTYPRINAEIGRFTPVYDIYQIFDGVSYPTTQTLSNPDDTIQITPIRKAPAYFRYMPVSLSLNMAEMIDGVKVYPARQLIEVTFKMVPERITYTVKQPLGQDMPFSIVAGPDNVSIRVEDGKFTLCGAENEWFDHNDFRIVLPDDIAQGGTTATAKCCLTDNSVIVEINAPAPVPPAPASRPAGMMKQYWYVPVALLALAVAAFLMMRSGSSDDSSPRTTATENLIQENQTPRPLPIDTFKQNFAEKVDSFFTNLTDGVNDVFRRAAGVVNYRNNYLHDEELPEELVARYDSIYRYSLMYPYVENESWPYIEYMIHDDRISPYIDEEIRNEMIRQRQNLNLRRAHGDTLDIHDLNPEERHELYLLISEELNKLHPVHTPIVRDYDVDIEDIEIPDEDGEIEDNNGN